jgi:hypothetical protein
MQKVVINNCFGGFRLSKKAVELFNKYAGTNFECDYSMNRHFRKDDNRYAFRSHPILVRVVEELGTDAASGFTRLRIAEVPDGVDWEITEYDGKETIRERSQYF